MSITESMDALVELALRGNEVSITNDVDITRMFGAPTSRRWHNTWRVAVSNEHGEVWQNGRDLPAVIDSAIEGFKAAQP